MSDSQSISKTAISIIIPVLNEEKRIGGCLQSLVRQDLPADLFEVIVVDNGSSDRTLAVVGEFQRALSLKILKKKGGYISALRNLGAASASGQFLVFLDADCLAPQHWLSTALDGLRKNGAAVIGAHYAIPEDSSWMAKAWYLDQHTLKDGPVSYIPSGDLMVSRDLFFRIGGFDETIETNEDSEFCHRASAQGAAVLAYPSLSVIHLGTPQTLRAFYRKHRWQGSAVRQVFLRRALRSGNLRAISFALYTTFWLTAALVALPVAVLRASFAVLLVPAGFLLLGPFILAVRAAWLRKRWAILAPLTFLFLVYGLARAVCLLGIKSSRSVRPTDTGLQSTAVADQPAQGAN